MKHFLQVNDFTKDEIMKIFERTKELKSNPYQPLLKDRTLAMIFAKPSTRTRVSFETGMTQLGGHAIYLGRNDMQLGRGETIADTARVLSRYVDVMMARLFAHRDIEELAKHSSVPVINGLTDEHHPCQAMADIFTVYEHKGRLEGLRLAWVGDGNNNVCHSLMQMCARVGMDMVVGCPEGYEPNEEVRKETRAEVVKSPLEAVKDADIVVTDTWVSMGQEEEKKKREEIFPPYQLNSELLKAAKPDAIVMHCLPAHRGQEITDEVMDGPHSVIFDEAENRLHVQKAIILYLLGKW